MTTFVAELGSNHNGDFGRACALIDLAAHAGCSAVKLQYFRLFNLYAESLHAERAHLKALELPESWLPLLCDRAHRNGLTIGITLCDVHGLDAVRQYDFDFLKVSSYSMLHTELLKSVAGVGLPVVLGCGMATFAELWAAVEALKGPPLTLLHCRSIYPTPIEACDMGMILNLHKIFRGCEHGWSDHTGHPAAIMAAMGYGARMIECHLDVDGSGSEAPGGHCWLPETLAATITLATQMKIAMGYPDKIGPHPFEEPERAWRADPIDGLRPMLAKRAELAV